MYKRQEQLDALYENCDEALHPAGLPYSPGLWWRSLIVAAYCIAVRRSALLALRWSCLLYTSSTQPAPPLQMLRRCRLFQGIGPAELQKIAEQVQHRHFDSGDVIFRRDEPGDSMFIVARGRVKCVVEQEDGEFELLDYEEQGGHFGDLSLLVGGLRTSTATAVMDTELLELSHDRFQSLMMSVPGFAANLSRSLGFKLRGHTNKRPSRRRSAVVGIINSTLRTQALVKPLEMCIRDRQYPMTRGVYANMYRGRLWTTRQFAGFGMPEEDVYKRQVLAYRPE